MFVRLFFCLRKYGIAVSTQELLALNRAIALGVVFADQNQFYQLAKIILVKDEQLFDKFDRAMKDYFEGIASVNFEQILSQLPKGWFDLERTAKNLTLEQRAALQQAHSLDELMQLLATRLREQHKKHQGGQYMVGTGGTSPFGAYGDHSQGVRVGGPARKQSAVKVWEQRNYRNLDTDQTLSSRQIQLALRRLRRFARLGAKDELDIKQTIHATAQQGLLDVQWMAERRNRIKLIMLFDVGGSMDAHISQCERLFKAAKTEFKALEYFYFHNCLYDSVWKDNLRKQTSRIDTRTLLHKYGRDYRVIIVGDASMAPYELESVGGSLEYMNEDSGRTWLQRLRRHFLKTAWLNPQEPAHWQYTSSVKAIETIFEEKMYPMTLTGLEHMTRYLSR